MRISRMIINYVRIESVCETLKVAVKVNTKKLRLGWFKCVQCRFSVGKHWRQAQKKISRGRHHGHKLHKELDKPKPQKRIHIPIPHMVEI